MDRSEATADVPDGAKRPADTTLRGRWLLVARMAWVAVAVLAVGLFIAGLPFNYDESVTVCTEVDCDAERLLPEDAEALRDLGLSEGFYAWFFIGIVVVFVLPFTLVGGLIFWRRSNDWMAMLVSLALVSFGVSWTEVPTSLVTASPEWRFAPGFVSAAGFGALFLVFYLFPDGRFVPRWARFVAFLWIAVNVGLFVDSVFAQESYGAEGSGPQGTLAVVVDLVVVAVVLVGIYAQIYRYTRYSTPVQRQQSKWVMAGLTTAVLLVTTGITLNGTVLSSPGLPRLMGNMVGIPLLQVIPVMVVPGAIGVSILRYRLWDMDVVINRTLVYGSLTAMLAAIYVAAVVLLQLAFRGVVDQAGPVAFVISTLAIAALFLPLRKRLQDVIDRRLYRRKYDAFRTLEALGVRMRDEVDLSILNDELLAAVRETVQPSHVSLQLLESADAEESGWIKAHFQDSPDLVEIDKLDSDSPAVQALRAAGTRITVPLLSQGELVGLINLGPRLSGQDYSTDDRKLLSDMANQAAPAVRVGQLVRQRQAEAEERHRAEQELQVARVIQQTLLPKELPKLPDWQVAAHYQPARAVGGDFYDFIELPKDELGIVIGDVTDKGTPAALVMATTRSLLRPAAQRHVSPGEVLELVNDLLHPDIPPNMFVTCLYAVLDPSTGRIRFANAGHDLPYQRTANGTVELRATGMPLGLMRGMRYEEMEATIAPGDSVLLYSDGLIEAHNPSGEMFGFPRTKELVAAHPGGGSLIQFLLAELAGFTGEGWEQEDDVTLVTLQRDSTGDVGGGANLSLDGREDG